MAARRSACGLMANAIFGYIPVQEVVKTIISVPCNDKAVVLFEVKVREAIEWAVGLFSPEGDLISWELYEEASETFCCAARWMELERDAEAIA